MKYITIGKRTTYRDNWHTVKDIAMNDQQRTTCEVCGTRPSTDAHHAIVKRDKNCPAVDSLINVQMVCHRCHLEGKADGWTNTKRAMRDSVRRYGKEEVERWLFILADEGKQVQEQFTYIGLLNDKGEEE